MPLLSPLALALCAVPSPQSDYEYVELTGPNGVGLDEVFDFNDAGVVAGAVSTSGGLRPALWSADGGLQLLPGFSTPAAATSVNNRGQVSGSFIDPSTSDTPLLAFRFDEGSILTFDPVGTTEVTAGVDITEDGRLLISSGFAGSGAASTLIARALFGDENGTTPVFAGITPRAASSSGNFAGSRGTFSNGVVSMLLPLTPGGTPRAEGVNDLGLTVGTISVSAGGFSSALTPVYWDLNQQPVVIPVANTSDSGIAFDINNQNVIVGRADAQAFLYEVGGDVIDLQSSVTGLPTGRRLREARRINERGQVLGLADDGSFFNSQSFILTPVEQPGRFFCTPGLNTTGRRATLFAEGSASLGANSLGLQVTDAVDGFGIFFAATREVDEVPFGDGFRCLGGPFQRIPPAVSIQDGQASVNLDLPSLGAAAGQSLYFQCFYRDSSPSGFNVSQALEIPITQ